MHHRAFAFSLSFKRKKLWRIEHRNGSGQRLKCWIVRDCLPASLSYSSAYASICGLIAFNRSFKFLCYCTFAVVSFLSRTTRIGDVSLLSAGGVRFEDGQDSTQGL